MSTPTPQQSIARLVAALPPREPLSPARVEVLLNELADVDDDLLADAVTLVIRTSHRFPTIAELREAAAESLLDLPTEIAALRQIDDHMRWRDNGGEGAEPQLHPLVYEHLRLVGGYHAFRYSDKPGVVRAQFRDYYRGARDDTIRSAQLSRRALPA